MTVQLKNTIVRKAINEIVNTGIDRGDHELVAPILLSTRGMQIDLESGTVTLKFKPNKAMVTEPSKTPAKAKAKGKKADIADPSPDTPVFERGEKSTLKREYKENIVEFKDKGVVLKHFGQTVELGAKATAFLIVGFEDGKFVCRNVKGKDVNKPIKTVLAALGDEAPAKAEKKPSKSTKKTSEKKPSKGKKQKSKGKKSKLDFEEMKPSPVEDKISKRDLRKMEKTFASQSAKLEKDGVEANWFYKVVTVKRKRLRLLKLSASKKQFGTVNIDTGKKSRLSVSDLLPL